MSITPQNDTEAIPSRGMPAEETPLILAGMPLSGAAVVAQALFEAGLFLGSRLHPTDRLDASGPFTNADVAAFHHRVLHALRADPHVPESLTALAVPADLREQGLACLRADPAPGQGVWGWKDPLTTLFLDYWEEQVPEARWIFVVRHPAQMAWSFLVRDVLKEAARTQVGRAQVALDLWTAYNRRILDFAERHHGRTRILVAPDDFSASGRQRLERWLAGTPAFASLTVDLEAVYNPFLMKRGVPRWLRTLARTHRTSQQLWRRLVGPGAASGPPAVVSVRPGVTVPEQPVVGLASRHQFANTETFIQAQLLRLPAHVIHVHGAYRASKYTRDHMPLLSGPKRVLHALGREFRIQTRTLHLNALRRYLRRHRIQAVLAHFGPAGADMLPACRAEGIPLIVHFHGYDAHKTSTLAEYGDAYAELFDEAAALIVVSRDMERQLVALGAPPERITLNPCGVDPSYFAGADPAAAPPVFLAVGRFVEKKAPHLTLLAFRQVLSACPEARLVMIGNGVLWDTCRQLAAAFKLNDAVTFVGPQPHAVIAASMRRVRGFVQHSIRSGDGNAEGTPVSLLEASASGLPVVSTRHAGIKEAVRHGETGFLVDEGDVDAMAAHMIELVQYPDLAARMGREGRAHIVEHYALDRSIARLSDVIERVLRNGTAAQ